jgi:hypothetical protein
VVGTILCPSQPCMKDLGSPQPHTTVVFFLIINFWLHWVFVAAHGLSLVVVSWGLLSVCGVPASHCGGFSCCRAEALVYWLSSSYSVAYGVLLDPAIKSSSPALEGRVLTTGPPGKSLTSVLSVHLILAILVYLT